MGNNVNKTSGNYNDKGKDNMETLPEAQRTQDIDFIIQIIFMAEIKQSNKQTNKQNNKQSNKTTNKQDVLVYPIFIFAIFLKI